MGRFFAHWKRDLPSGLVVFLVAIPLCLGIALASGTSLFSGLIAGVIGGIVVGSLSGSQLSVSGPAAGLILIVISAIEDMGGFEYFLVALVIAGLLQLLMGYLKLGIIGMYFPTSVIKGMLAAIGLILIFQQLPYLLGLDKISISALGDAVELFHPGALVIGFISLGIVLIWEIPALRKYAFFRLIPGALIAVITGIFLSLAFRGGWAVPDNHTVFIPNLWAPGEISNAFTFPAFSWSILATPVLWKTAVVIALIASLESLLSLEAVDKMGPHKTRSGQNRELKAQGVANSISGLIGGLPITAVIVRSTANIHAGAQTRFSAIFHGVLLMITVLLIPNVLNLIPYASLAAILVVVGYKLTKPSLYKLHYRAGFDQFVPFVVTVVAILATDLLVGIMTGLTVGVFFVLRANFRTAYFYHVETGPENGRKLIKIRLSEHVSFINKASLQKTLESLPSKSHVIIDGRNSADIDYDALIIIHEYRTQAEDKEIELELLGIPEVPA